MDLNQPSEPLYSGVLPPINPAAYVTPIQNTHNAQSGVEGSLNGRTAAIGIGTGLWRADRNRGDCSFSLSSDFLPAVYNAVLYVASPEVKCGDISILLYCFTVRFVAKSIS
jgi:hypothetical protein